MTPILLSVAPLRSVQHRGCATPGEDRERHKRPRASATSLLRVRPGRRSGVAPLSDRRRWHESLDADSGRPRPRPLGHGGPSARIALAGHQRAERPSPRERAKATTRFIDGRAYSPHRAPSPATRHRGKALGHSAARPRRHAPSSHSGPRSAAPSAIASLPRHAPPRCRMLCPIPPAVSITAGCGVQDRCRARHRAAQRHHHRDPVTFLAVSQARFTRAPRADQRSVGSCATGR